MAIAVTLSIPTLAVAEDLPAHCLQSFDVKDRGFTTGPATMSCRLLEERRRELFAQINGIKSAGDIDGAELSKQIDALATMLEEEQSKSNWVGLASAITGNALATVGLAACIETAAVGCAVALVGKAMAVVDVIDSANEADKAKRSTEYIVRLRALSVSVKTRKSQAKALRDRLVQEFTQACIDVKTQCL
ncbi:MAG: hypothetical protein KJ067_17810 [Vicinamibacteria bacterium]|nr:hypothetical protein [Vicinamibacteria bacterium]